MKTLKFTIFGLFLLMGINLTAQVYVNNANLRNSDEINKTTKIAGIDFSSENYLNNYFKETQSYCDTILSFATKPMPSGLTWDGQDLWYVDTAYIYKLNSSGSYIDSIVNPAPDGTFFKGGGLCFDGTYLWYADEESAQLYKINPNNGNIAQQLPLPSFGQSDPNGFGLAWDGEYLWHSQYSPQKIYKINSNTGQVIDSLVPTDMILGIAWINGYLYGLSSLLENTIINKINTNTGILEDTSSWCVPYSLGLTWDGTSFWTVSGQDSIFGISTGGKQRIYKLNSGIMDIAQSEYLNPIKIYPNPALNVIVIEMLQKTKTNATTCEILNTEGKLIWKYLLENGENRLDISELNSGLFFIKVKSEDRITIKKLIKQ